MNATGESDTQNYHDNIRSFQQQRLRPVQERQIDWIGCDIWGWPVWQRKRRDLEISYPPLWSETAREKADRIAIYAGMVNALLTSGMIDPDAAIKELKAREVFATDIEAAEFLDQGPGLEGSPLDPENPLRELEGMQGGKKAGRMLRDPGASFKRGISMNAGDFVEGDHPRDGDGTFKEKGGDGGEQADEAKPDESSDDIETKRNIQSGLDAIERVLRTKSDVLGAMNHEQLGSISFLWGKPGDPSKKYKGGYGISHILAKHGREVLFMMPEVIARGEITRRYGQEIVERVDIKLGSHIAVLSKRKDADDRWLLTGWDENVPR